jgi:hypothetical protein
MLLGMFDIGMLLLKLLAVAGGAAIGVLGAGVTVKFILALTIRRKAPLNLIRAFQVLGGGGLGLAVYIWAFGSGGSGFGSGGGVGGIGQGAAEQPVNNLVSQIAPPESDLPPAKSADPAHRTIRVDMLGGSQVNARRFYKLEGDTQPFTLAELGPRILDKHCQGIEVVIHPNSVAQEHPAVHELGKWARQNNLTVSLSFPLEE